MPAKSFKKDEEGLNRLQRRFVENYLVTPDAWTAAKAAQTDPTRRVTRNHGHRMLLSPAVQAAIARRQMALGLVQGLTEDVILGNIMRISDEAEAAEQYTAALKAQELLGKYKGMWIERHVNVNIDATQAHMEALKAKMAARKAQKIEPLGVTFDPFGV